MYKWLTLFFEMQRAFPFHAVNPLVAKAERCPICWNALWSYRELPCGHMFHEACIGAWFARQKNCPMCRSPVFAPMPSSPPPVLVIAPRFFDSAPPAPVEEASQRLSWSARLCRHCCAWVRRFP